MATIVNCLFSETGLTSKHIQCAHTYNRKPNFRVFPSDLVKLLKQYKTIVREMLIGSFFDSSATQPGKPTMILVVFTLALFISGKFNMLLNIVVIWNDLSRFQY